MTALLQLSGGWERYLLRAVAIYIPCCGTSAGRAFEQATCDGPLNIDSAERAASTKRGQ